MTVVIAQVTGYSKKMDVYYLSFGVFNFSLKAKKIKTENSEHIYATVVAYLENKTFEEFSPVNSGTLASLGRKDAVATIGANSTQLKGLPATLMKEASNIRYLSHIKALFSLVH